MLCKIYLYTYIHWRGESPQNIITFDQKNNREEKNPHQIQHSRQRQAFVRYNHIHLYNIHAHIYSYTKSYYIYGEARQAEIIKKKKDL